MEQTIVKNKDLFYFSRPDNVSYVRSKKGTINLQPIIIMDPLGDGWEKLGEIFSNRKYLIVDGHNRAFVDSTNGLDPKALKLTSDKDLEKIKPMICNAFDKQHGIEHIIISQNITSMGDLNRALLDNVKESLRRNKLMSSREQEKFHYGK